MACMIRGEIRRSWLTWIGGRGAEALYFQQVPLFLGGVVFRFPLPRTESVGYTCAVF